MIDETTFKVDSHSLVIDSGSQRRLSDEMILRMNLKSQLKLYLDEKNISANQLAKLSGVSKQVLSLWMSGASPKKLDQVKCVADCLGTSIDHLCFGKGIEKSFKNGSAADSFPEDEWLSGQFEIKVRRLKK